MDHHPLWALNPGVDSKTKRDQRKDKYRERDATGNGRTPGDRPTPGGEPLCNVAGSIRWQQAAPGSGPWLVGDPASHEVLQVGRRKFGSPWLIQIQG